MKRLLLILFLFAALNSFSQAPEISWQKTIGGNLNDLPKKIIQTSDNGFIIAGSSNSEISGYKTENCYGYIDFWIVKLDSNGTFEWEKTIGGSLYDELISIIETNEGDFILAGSSSSNISNDKSEDSRGEIDYWIVKINASGLIIWDKTYGGTGVDKISTIQKTSDNGFIVGGYSNSNISGDKTENSKGSFDYWVIKINDNGQMMWQKTIGGSNNDELKSIIQLIDGSYILAGLSFSNISGDRTISNSNFQDAWLVKLSNFGTIIWQENYNVEDFSKLISTSDGNFILAGSNYLSSNALKTEQSYQFKSLIFKINPNGDVIWNHSEQYNGGDCIATDVIEASDGYYYTSNSTELTDNAVISKLDFDGNLIWFKNFSTQSNEYIYSLSNTTDQAIICLIKSNANNFGDKTEDSFGLSDYWVVKLQPSNLNNTIKEQFNFEVFPNPFLSKINIINNNLINYNVLLYNSLGQEIIRIDNFNDKIQTFDVTILSGYYFLKVTNTITNEFINFKLIKL